MRNVDERLKKVNVANPELPPGLQLKKTDVLTLYERYVVDTRHPQSLAVPSFVEVLKIKYLRVEREHRHSEQIRREDGRCHGRS